MTEPTPSAPRQGLPLEEPGRPFFPGLFDTLKLIVVDPKGAFGRMSLTSDLSRPLIYAVILGFIGALIPSMWSFAIQGSLLGILGHLEGMDAIVPPMIFGMFGTFVGLLLAPVFIVIGIFIWSSIIHLFLLMVGGANHGFSATLRVVCYSQSAQLAQLIPLFGDLAATVWGLVLAIIGVAEAHGTTLGRAAAAVLLPVVFCCVCIAAIALIAVTGALLSQ